MRQELQNSEAVSRKRGVPVYRTNPSIPSAAEIKRNRRARIGTETKGLVVDTGTGEILGHGGAMVYEWEEVDKERFVKLYLAGGSPDRRRSALMFSLTVLGLMLLLMAASNARPDELPLLRVLSLGCVAWLVAATLRKFKKHGGGQASNAVKTDPPAIVAWVTGPAGSAPSRALATSNLPDYALGVMGLQRVDR